MAQTKRDLLAEDTVSNQQALVKRLIGNNKKKLKRPIPGGKNLFHELDVRLLEKAVYNWLKGCRFFKEVTISLAKDPEKFSVVTERVTDLDTNSPYPQWVTHEEGKMFLARLLTKALTTNKCVGVKADREGVYVLKDRNNTFDMIRLATQEDVDAYEAAVERAKAEMKITGVRKALPPGPQVGDKLISEDWEPYVEFVPVKNGEYR